MSYKISFGVISRFISQTSPFINFIENAKSYHHNINLFIFGYRDYIDKSVIKRLEKYCEINELKIGSDYLYNRLSKLGLTQNEIDALIGAPYLKKYNIVSYGTSRNYVMIDAILNDVDFLLFFDTDVYPQILFEDKKHKYRFENIDFVGSHLNVLTSSPHIAVTTSDYSGYFIIPHMNFPHLDKLLFGLQKEDAFDIISQKNRLVIKHNKNVNIHKTKKILGGNMAIDIRKLNLLAPFYSTCLTLDNQCYLGRGEDTLFGPLITKYGGFCVDIDLPIFHNTFGDFPNKPTFDKKSNVDRFFYAGMGWLIRNPFYNWFHADFLKDYDKIDIKTRYESLQIGSQVAAKYFNDKRFLRYPKAFKMAYNNLDIYKDNFFRLIDAWDKFKRKVMK